MKAKEYKEYLLKLGFIEGEKDHQIGFVYRLNLGDFTIKTSEYYPYTWIRYKPTFFSIQKMTIPTKEIIEDVKKMEDKWDLYHYDKQ